MGNYCCDETFRVDSRSCWGKFNGKVVSLKQRKSHETEVNLPWTQFNQIVTLISSLMGWEFCRTVPALHVLAQLASLKRNKTFKCVFNQFSLKCYYFRAYFLKEGKRLIWSLFKLTTVAVGFKPSLHSSAFTFTSPSLFGWIYRWRENF